MKPLSASELLDVWEKGSHRSPVEKAMLLLHAACADGQPADPALLSIGDRDALLLQLREWMFGSQLSNISSCPHCGEKIEWSNQVADLRPISAPQTAASRFTLQAEPFTIRFRLLNSYDLFTALAAQDGPFHPHRLIAGCILDVQKEDSGYQAADLPAEVFELLDQRMSAEDPQADIRMALSCPACTHAWELQFDIVSYLWAEIHSWAKHILQDIALLAASFGWPEAHILQLSPQRRRAYLDIIRK